MPEWIPRLLIAAAALTAAAMQTLFYTHMLQLNSYYPSRFFRWMQENPGRVWSLPHLLCVPALLTLFLAPEAGGIAAALWLFFCAALCRPKKAKKPLVFTARVKRLLTTTALLWIVLCALQWFLPRQAALCCLILPLCAAWLPLLMALAINTPMERSFAAFYRRDAVRRLKEMPQLTVIGITGSYGKTSVKNYLHALLSARYNVLMTPENFNTPLGLIRTIREHLSPAHQIFLAEMGAKNVGDIRELCELVHPRYGVITAIGEQHLETFGSVDNILHTKFELADALPADGCLFLNMDDDRIRAHAPTLTVPVVGYGLTQGDYTVSDVTQDALGTHFVLNAPGGERQTFTTRLLGRHNLQNLAGCIAVAHRFGIPLADLCYPVRMLHPVEHRLQLLPGGIIDDAYNSNPAGFRAALEVLRDFPGQRILVTPGMVELGERQEALNRELGAAAADCCDYAVLVGQRQAPPLREGLLSAGFPPDRLYVADTLTDGMAFIRTLPAAEKRTILLENDLPDNF